MRLDAIRPNYAPACGAPMTATVATCVPPQPPPDSPIQGELNRLHGDLEVLHKTVSEIEHRLAVVSLQYPGEAALDPEPTPARCAVGSQVAGCSESVRAATNRLSGLIDALQV